MREMKDSGIEWIGEIPKDWKIARLCYLIDGYKAGPFGSALIMDKLSDEGNILIYTPETIATGNTELPTNKYLPECRKDEMQQFFVKSGDIIFPIVGSLGRAMVVNENMPIGIINQRLAKFRLSSNEIVYPFFMRLFGESDFFQTYIELMCRGSIIVNLTKMILHDMPVPIPPIKEQQQISDYLDPQCSEIDATAEDIQKEISLLEDYKKSLIYNVISDGINHSAYSTETDEVWGNVPQGWKLVDIKYLFEIVKRIAGKEGYDVLSVTQKGLKVKDITSGDGQLADNYSGYQFVYPTDYVMNHMDLLTGWVDCSELFGVTSPDYRVFRLMDKAANNLVYYKYVMQCCYMNKIFYSLGQGVSNLGRWRLQTSSFNNFKVPVPTKAEQDEIADYLDSKCSEIDSLIADKKRQLDILADYKKSLIYEYVTGKKEVPVNE